jgi:hypothetical protein
MQFIQSQSESSRGRGFALSATVVGRPSLFRLHKRRITMFTNGKFSSALVPLVVVAILVVTQGPSAFAQAGSPAPAMNPIQIENAKPGTPGWELENPAMGRQIEGYASLASVNRGEKIASLKRSQASDSEARC